MKTNKAFLFNEEEEAERILKEGFDIEGIDYGKMYIIAKYFREKYNYGEIRLEREIIDFCQSVDSNFNPITQAEYIQKWVKSAMKYDLRKINSIYITKKDVEFLREIENEKHRKILFAMLVLAKAMKISGTKRGKEDYKTSDNYYIRYNNLSDVTRISRISNVSEMALALILHEYKQYFTFYSPYKELIRVDFVDTNGDDDIEIDNLEDISEMYEKLFGKDTPTFICERCGKEFEKTGRYQKYCAECAQSVKYEKVNAINRKNRRKL